ncbi:pilus assembly FimT family protein [Geomesophilobacter sediminis]|uniref:Type II secretion system protein H n=1 Tax=Geomesophilobacter sediminis TaxID=2798584 RepID=A0A8J7M2G8_9BACT|nr:GspH/FimT family pseudopilin [Geomesophilobacter sediminis]MBJ6727442.1 prepilin-type N-terminal cleavage/methylation domain-containing protein [Geomesophilobacter sediminis]
MDRSGFSLIEILVVLAITTLLGSFATIKYREYLQRYKSDQQTRSLRAELMRARIYAVTQQREVLVRFAPDHFHVYSSNVADDTPRTTRLAFPVSVKLSYGASQIKFDQRGMANLKGDICIEDQGGTGSVDSVIISPTRISIGKRQPGKDCNEDYIDLK